MPPAQDYDLIVCGAEASGSVVAGRLAEQTDARVLLLEAGGTDGIDEVMDPSKIRTNIGSERDWQFRSEPSPELNGRILKLAMGKVLGGGSSINVMLWARGHKTDWDHFAAESRNQAWSYDSVLELYRRVEDWHGAPDAHRRGVAGPAYVQPAPDPSPLAHAAIEGAASVGIKTFGNPNGRMMESVGGTAIADLRLRNGRRESSFRSYAYPMLEEGPPQRRHRRDGDSCAVSRSTRHRSRTGAIRWLAGPHRRGCRGDLVAWSIQHTEGVDALGDWR